MVSLAAIHANLPVEPNGHFESRSDLPALWRAAKPVAGQSLRGLTAHALRRNRIGTAWRVLRTVGAPARNRPLLSEHASIDEERLSAALRVDEEVVRRRRYPLNKSGERMFFSLPVPHGGIENRERRFAPNLLKTQRHHLAVWELRLLPFCPVSWDYLISRCECRPGKTTTQGWTRTGSYPDQCDECGRDLSRLLTTQVSVEKRDDLALAAELVLDVTNDRADWRRHLPADLQDVDTAALFRVLHVLADHIVAEEHRTAGLDAGGHNAVSFGNTSASEIATERLRLACVTLVGWPYAIEKARFDLTSDSPLLVKLQKDYCRLGRVRNGQVGGEEKGCANLNAPTSRKINPIGIREASALAGLSPETLEAIWSAGHITRYVRPHGGRVLPAFDAAELTEIANRWRERLDCGSVAYRLGITRYGLAQLTTSGILRAGAINAPGCEPAFLEADVKEFERALVVAAGPTPSASRSIANSLRAISGRLKPWSALIAAMLDGSITYGITVGKEPVLERVVLPVECCATDAWAEIEDHELTESELCSQLCQADALEILNCSASSVAILSGLSSQGLNPRMFDRVAVLGRARHVVATAEVAERLSIHPAKVARIMKSANIHEVVRSGWPRARTVRFIEHVRLLKQAQTTLPFGE